MPTLACPRCARFYKVKKIGVYFEEGMPIRAVDGEAWQGYKLWAGDLFECESCGAQVIGGVGQAAIAEHYEERYGETVANLKPLCRVDDCMGPFRGSKPAEVA